MNDVHVPAELLLGEPGAGWEQVTNELMLERSGPDRFLSVMPLVRLFMEHRAGTWDDHAAALLGRPLAHLWAIRQMSLAVARLTDMGQSAGHFGAMVKDLGTVLEQEIVDAIRRLMEEEIIHSGDTDFMRLLEEAILMGPSFTIRGGTTEILRSIVARGLRVS
jgi:alkylation response protein AidB-like acyl-CoA dehydrogenase